MLSHSNSKISSKKKKIKNELVVTRAALTFVSTCWFNTKQNKVARILRNQNKKEKGYLTSFTRLFCGINETCIQSKSGPIEKIGSWLTFSKSLPSCDSFLSFFNKDSRRNKSMISTKLLLLKLSGRDNNVTKSNCFNRLLLRWDMTRNVKTTQRDNNKNTPCFPLIFVLTIFRLSLKEANTHLTCQTSPFISKEFPGYKIRREKKTRHRCHHLLWPKKKKKIKRKRLWKRKKKEAHPSPECATTFGSDWHGWARPFGLMQGLMRWRTRIGCAVSVHHRLTPLIEFRDYITSPIRDCVLLELIHLLWFRS